MSDRSLADLETRAWTQWFRAPSELAATAQELIRQGLARADAGLECLGLLFAVRPAIAARADADAERALDLAELRSRAAGQVRVLRLVHDLRAFLWLRRGEIDRAWQLAHAADQRSDTARPPMDRTINALGLAEIALQRADFDAVVEQGYRAMRCADLVGITAVRAIATHNLATKQLNLLNLDVALPLQLEAQALFRRAGMDSARRHVWENLILIHDAQERPIAAARTLAEWRAAVGDFSARELQDQGVAIALGLLAVGQPGQAMRIVESPEQDPDGDRHRTTAWIWAQGRVLLALGQADRARRLCEDFLAAAASRTHPETPYNLVRLYDVLREACETLGDFRAALLANKASQRAALPLLGQSTRARYLSLKLQQPGPDAEAQPAARNRKRLEALDRSIGTLRQSMEEEKKPATEADLAEQRRFVAYVGHEIRSALAGVMGVNSLLLMESKLDPRQSRYVSLSTQSVRGALALVNDILDMAKLEAGRFDIVCRPLDITRLARDLTSEFEVLALEKGLRLVCDAPPDMAEVQADGRRLRQVLSNLLGNALNFTDAGDVTVRVERRDAAAGTACVYVAVEDSGPGIAAEDLPALFAEFSQIGAGADQRHGGSGLGLVLSRELLRCMGSELNVRSQPGVGTTFWFTFTAPRAEAGDGERPPSDPSTSPDPDQLAVASAAFNVGLGRMTASAFAASSR